MLFSATLLLTASALVPSCVAPTGGKNTPPTFFLERTSSQPDTIVSVRICLSPPKGGLGSYNMTLTYDSTQMLARKVDVSGGGLQVANPDVPGTIRIAGASPGGFHAGTLATIAFRAKRGKPLGHIRLTLVEASSPSGSSVLDGSIVAGYPASDRSLGVVKAQTQAARSDELTVPRIDSLSPRAAKFEDEGVIEIALYGRGFAAAGNTILFDSVAVTGVASERNGTVVRFLAPNYIPPKGQATGRRVTPGRYQIEVRTPAGTSNAVSFLAREGAQ